LLFSIETIGSKLGNATIFSTLLLLFAFCGGVKSLTPRGPHALPP
jgi:hypothetical protein